MVSSKSFNRILTGWFFTMAALNGVCSVAFLIQPSFYLKFVGGPQGDAMLPILQWTVRIQAGYFVLATGALIIAAMSPDPRLRRNMSIAFTVPGIWLIAASIFRATQPGGTPVMAFLSCLVTVAACAPFVWAIFRKMDGDARNPYPMAQHQGWHGDHV